MNWFNTVWPTQKKKKQKNRIIVNFYDLRQQKKRNTFFCISCEIYHLFHNFDVKNYFNNDSMYWCCFVNCRPQQQNLYISGIRAYSTHEILTCYTYAQFPLDVLLFSHIARWNALLSAILIKRIKLHSNGYPCWFLSRARCATCTQLSHDAHFWGIV